MRLSTRFFLRSFLASAGVLLLSSAAGAQAGAAKNSAPYFVSTQWVADHLKDPSLVLLAVGEKSEYDGGHIPGARNFEYDRVSTPHGSGLMLELPPVEQLVKVFEDAGVSDSSRLVVYFSSEWVTPTARVYLTLDYLGLRDRLSYLDGGMAAWRKEGRAVSTETPKFAKGTLTAHPRNDVVVKVDVVQQDLHKAGVAIVDVREAKCYGSTGNCYGERPGHIPGAVNIPWEVLVGDDLKLKSVDELRGIFQRAGVKPGDEVIAYCHVGQRASLVYM
ncbi:MAG: rhodanese-like domain-containing protein, partial [Candidatus Acidiferrales bacterium]